MANLEFWTEYHAECPMCGTDVVLSYMPAMGETFECECGRRNVCTGITEACRPVKKERRRNAAMKKAKN